MSTTQAIPLNMDAIAAQAIQAKPRRAWSLEYLSDGITFRWVNYALDEAHADTKAREELGGSYPAFSKVRARLVACVEVAA